MPIRRTSDKYPPTNTVHILSLDGDLQLHRIFLIIATSIVFKPNCSLPGFGDADGCRRALPRTLIAIGCRPAPPALPDIAPRCSWLQRVATVSPQLFPDHHHYPTLCSETCSGSLEQPRSSVPPIVCDRCHRRPITLEKQPRSTNRTHRQPACTFSVATKHPKTLPRIARTTGVRAPVSLDSLYISIITSLGPGSPCTLPAPSTGVAICAGICEQALSATLSSPSRFAPEDCPPMAAVSQLPN